ncbi:MAG: hypothetical protein ACTS6J_23580, partial [Burkholderiales bacterium]
TGTEQAHEVESGGLPFKILNVAGAHAPSVGVQTVDALAPGKPQTGGLILDLAPNDVGPRLFGQRSSHVELEAHHAIGARMRQKGQEDTARLM